MRSYPRSLPWILLICLGVLYVRGNGDEATAGVGSYEDWLRHQEAVLPDSSLVGHYRFEDVQAGGAAVGKIATGSGSAPLSFKVVQQDRSAAREDLRIVTGRWPQKKAVRLDRGYFVAQPFAVPNKAFTAAAWVRLNGPGALRGNNGTTNGTLLSVGSGYTEGWRLTVHYPLRALGFEIGRKPHSIGIRANEVPADGVWHHVAVAWDGHEMRIYLDGLLAASGPYDGEYTATTSPFRIGYANAGVGSVVLDVDEVALYNRSLAAAEILRSAEQCGPEAPGVRLNLARACRDRNDLPTARGHYQALLQSPDLDARSRAEASFEFADLCTQMGDLAATRSVCAKIAASADAPAHYRSLAGLRIARSYALEKSYAAARAEYDRVVKVAGAPPHHVWEAAECTREMERLERGLPGRDPAASRTAAPKLPAPSITLFVMPKGADANAGTKEQPFATLKRARDEIRTLKRRGALPVGGVMVCVGGGDYRVVQTLKLTAEDSGTEQAPIVYAAGEKERPRFTGGVRVGGFTPVTEAAVLARLPEESRGKVWQADLRAQGISDYGKFEPGGYGSGRGFHTHPMLELLFDGQPLEIARWPNNSFVQTGEIPGKQELDSRGRQHGIAGQFTYAEDRPARWKGESDIWLYGYWFHDWSDSYEKVASIETASRVITLAPPLHRSGFAKERHYYALNLLSEIDRPGEWYLDRERGMLYLWPPSAPARATVELSMFAAPFVELDHAAHVTFRGLEWDLGRGDAIRLKGGEQCLLAGCTVSRFAGDGLVVDGGHGHHLLGCDIHTLGRGGVRIQGGDRKTLAASGHVIENCHLHHLSRIDHTYTPAVLANGAGIRIAHNLMHDIRSSAMRIEGNDHLVEFNEVHHVVWESDDQGGVDMFGNPTYRGNTYRYNFFHHIGSGRTCGQAGIRLDDGISGTLIYGNVFWRSADGGFGGVQIHGGKDNWVDNNVFVDCKQAISFSPWGESRWHEFLDRPEIVAQIRHVNGAELPYAERYPELARLREGADANRIWRNVAVQCGPFLLHDRGVHDLLDNSVVATTADASICDEHTVTRWTGANGRLAFRPIPFDEIGLYQDAFRANLPAPAGAP